MVPEKEWVVEVVGLLELGSEVAGPGITGMMMKLLFNLLLFLLELMVIFFFDGKMYFINWSAFAVAITLILLIFLISFLHTEHLIINSINSFVVFICFLSLSQTWLFSYEHHIIIPKWNLIHLLKLSYWLFINNSSFENLQYFLFLLFKWLSWHKGRIIFYRSNVCFEGTTLLTLNISRFSLFISTRFCQSYMSILVLYWLAIELKGFIEISYRCFVGGWIGIVGCEIRRGRRGLC